MTSPIIQPPVVHDDHTRRAVGRVEIIISTLLRTGVVSSLAIIMIGAILLYVRHPDYSTDPTLLPPLTTYGAPFPHSLRDVLSGLIALQGQAIISLGLLILIATPVMRVAISIVAFAIQRDYLFVGITCLVLTLLGLSFLIGHFSH
ncbi:DUF1634 domain-containing protein [soil metagenome]